jgi:hypothetical protein
MTSITSGLAQSNFCECLWLLLDVKTIRCVNCDYYTSCM